MGGRGARSNRNGNSRGLKNISTMSDSELAGFVSELTNERYKLAKKYFSGGRKTEDRKRLDEFKQKVDIAENELAKRRVNKPIESIRFGASTFTEGTTSTYERARKRRIKQFDNWFFGSGK